jgi:hypothetical protein
MRYGRHGNDFNVVYADPFGRQPASERRIAAIASPSKPPDAPAFRRRITLRDTHRSGGLEAGERPPAALVLAEYLRELDRQTNLPILADCAYVQRENDPGGRWRREQSWLTADIVERPLAETLDLLCADFEYEWEYREGALILRPIRWYAEPSERGYVYPKARFDEAVK